VSDPHNSPSKLASHTRSHANGAMASRPNRRQVLTAAAAGGAWSVASQLIAAAPASDSTATDAKPSAATDSVAFFVVGDTHYLADRESTGKMDVRSSAICGRLVDTLNRLPGTTIPDAAGGGQIATPRGLIHAGDVIDTGDKQGSAAVEMQKTEWSAFTDDYGLTGGDGRLKFPVYEVWGNHDSPHGKGLALDKIRERNKSRPAVGNVSENGLHYSWDWDRFHFVNLGLIVGGDRQVTRKRRYAALDSLDFLIADLRDKVGTSGRPIIITHHIDIARYTGPCDLTAEPGSKEWDPCDVRAFHQALQGYKVAAIFYGHTHARGVFRWDGQSPKATTGISVFNTDNASHFSGPAQAIFYVEATGDQVTVREYQTKDGWETGFFTPQKWTT